MFDAPAKRWRRLFGRLRVAVVTPVGPGHAELYGQCRASVESAWRRGHGPFAAISLIAIDDGEGKLGRSRARNIGIDRALAAGADWLFFIDADDLMVEGAFEAVAPYISGHDAVWGLILGLSPGAQRPHLRIPQIVRMDRLEDLLWFDPFLTLQMGHFVRAAVAQANRFDEALDAGEDFDYYLRLWSNHHCAKVACEFFINRHDRHATGPRAASAVDWGRAVRGRQQAERAQRGLSADAAAAITLRNTRAAELHNFCRLQALVAAEDALALSRQIPYHGLIEVDEYDGGRLLLHTANDDAICAQLAWTGEYQPFAVAMWQAIAAGGGVVVDIGSGTGLYALLAARVAPQSRVLALEAVAANQARARLNIDLNGVGNVELIEALASDADTTACLREAGAGAMLPLAAEIATALASAVQVVRLDGLLEQRVAGALALARIGQGTDVLAVLRGMTTTLQRDRPALLIDVAVTTVLPAIDQALRQHGYQCFTIDNRARVLRRFNTGELRLENGWMQLLASAGPTDEIGRLAASVQGRLLDV
jgi:FkbM family methyltransferase